MSRHTVLITNPSSGTTSRGKVEQTIRHIESQGAEVEVLYTEAPGHATELAARAVPSAPDLIITAGGDGTINEVINGMARSNVPLAILPAGTANVLARETGISKDPAAFRAIFERKHRRIALGLITYEGKSRYFALMAGFGFDALSVYNLNLSLKKRSGKFAYVVSGFHTLATWKAVPITLQTEGRELICSNVIISNVSRYGGGFIVAPRADITVPEFQVTALTGMGRSDILRFAAGIVAGRPGSMRDVEHFTATHITLNGETHIQIDGDHAGTSPAQVDIVPDALTLVY
jgi:diacylglycerol kinase (ATP)